MNLLSPDLVQDNLGSLRWKVEVQVFRDAVATKKEMRELKVWDKSNLGTVDASEVL